MVTQTEQLYDAATKLPPLERIELIERLFFSLDSVATRQKIDKRWAVEAEKRLAAFEDGKMSSIPADEVFKKLEAKSKR